MAEYTTTAISGYNDSPPSDDGVGTEANKVKWSTVKTKVGDPLKTAIEGIDTKLQAILTASTGRLGTVQVFTSSGTYTPPSGLLVVRVRVRGGGGSGAGAGGTTASEGSAGAGGSEGEYAEKIILASALGATETVTIGAGGASVNGQTNGNAGGTTSFGSHVTAAGGSGGATLANGATLAGVTGTSGGSGGAGGDIHIRGASGGDAMRTGTTDATTANGISGFGGGDGGGRAVRSGGATTTAGQAGVRGGGGSGAANGSSQGAAASGAGGDGWCVVEEYY